MYHVLMVTTSSLLYKFVYMNHHWISLTNSYSRDEIVKCNKKLQAVVGLILLIHYFHLSCGPTWPNLILHVSCSLNGILKRYWLVII